MKGYVICSRTLCREGLILPPYSVTLRYTLQLNNILSSINFFSKEPIDIKQKVSFRSSWRELLTPADKILIIILLFITTSSYYLVRKVFPFTPDRIAVVEIGGKEIRRFSLNSDLPPRRIPLRIHGGEVVFQISNGRIRILPMPDEMCDRHICSNKGWIEKQWDVIVCVPNKIVVRVIGKSEADDVDLITK